MTARLGFVLKVVDGASRARPPAVLAGLRVLGALPESAEAELTELSEPIVYTRKGARAGEIRARERDFMEARTG